MLHISHAYRTISTEAAQVIAGIEQLHLSGIRRVAVTNIQKSRGNAEEFQDLEIVRLASLSAAGQPAVFTNCVNTTQCMLRHECFIFTDSSRMFINENEVAVGSAFVCFEREQETHY
ncbi:hypothetical protein ANN_17798 [Periplaneta americana]|uniref:Uncharacterized protein n=1 Tax=Periplaneta americana TaxID=6978 RepID=A0ABQ8STY0_PERAM|nr:hypothetical protein ANN_17798 [Periplaneta americana]